jgi:DNA anti-recombination protein RmuC
MNFWPFNRESAGKKRHSEIINKLKEIMSAISDFAAKQKAFNDRQDAAIDSLVASSTGLTGDVADLKALIEKLQNSPGEISPEDQATLDELSTRAESTATKAEGVAAALKTLDEQTPPAPPTP